MSCPINLYDQLNIGCPNDPFCTETVPIDGVWTLYSSPVGYPISMLVDGSWQLLSNDTVQIGTDYNPTVDLAGLPYGDYRLEYAYGDGCKQTAYLDLIGLPLLCQPDDVTVLVCDTFGETSLYDILTQAISGTDCEVTAFGSWSVDTEVGPTWTQSDDDDGTNDTIDIENTTVDTPFIFTYTYHPENIDGESVCEECFRTVNMTLTASAAPTAGLGGDVVIC